MPDYVIRTKATRERPSLDGHDHAAVLTPPDFGCSPNTVGNQEALTHVMTCGDSTVTVESDDGGWFVSVGPPTGERDADELVAAMAERIEEATGDACEWVAVA
ncbi:MAG: hypothetical protein AAF945_18360 [Actinomycetota bacterium]